MQFKGNNKEVFHRQSIKSAPSICDKARLLAVTEQHTSDWIAAIHSPGLGLKLEANEFQTLIKMRLGLDIYDGQSNCPLCLSITESEA